MSDSGTGPKKEEPPKDEAPAAEGGKGDDGSEGASTYNLDAENSKTRGWRAIFWDPSEGTCLLRTPNSWMKVGIFYLIFFSFVAAVLYCGLAIFYFIISGHTTGPMKVFKTYPYIQMITPGIAPTLGTFDGEPRVLNLTAIQGNETKHEEKRRELLLKVLDPIFAIVNHSKSLHNAGQKYDWGPCSLPNGSLGEYLNGIDLKNNVTNEKTFGYGSFSPCVLVQLSKLYDWKPGDGTELKNSAEEKDIPNVEKFKAIPGNAVDGGFIPFYCAEDTKEGKVPENVNLNLTFQYYPLVGGSFKGLPKEFPIEYSARDEKPNPYVFVQVGISKRINKTTSLKSEVQTVRCFFLNDQLDLNERTIEENIGVASIKFGIIVVDED